MDKLHHPKPNKYVNESAWRDYFTRYYRGENPELPINAGYLQKLNEEKNNERILENLKNKLEKKQEVAKEPKI